jgi:glucose-6-phosphate isomerase
MTKTALPFTVSLELAKTGKGAAPSDKFDMALAGASDALRWLRESKADRSIELLGIPERSDDIDRASEAAAKLAENTSEVAVLGIGGSSLGGQALLALRSSGSKGPKVRFFDNPDPLSWAEALAGFDLKSTRFVAISKSGGTAETLIQALTAADAIEKAGGGKYLKHHFLAITEPRRSPLREFAESIGAQVIDHPTGVGGRYSVLTVVGVLPAILMGLDVAQLRAGAAAVLAQALSSDAADVPAAAGAALHQALAADGRLNQTVLWAYADRLHTFGSWWRQLWAESLGKNGKGSTPVSALGPVDQHSQLQLFRDGPANCLFTILSTETEGKGPAAPRERAEALGLSYLAGRTIGDLVAAEARATAETLARNGRPVRQIKLSKISEGSVGALMMHFMLETIVMGRLMGVDPFDQPGVEEGKVLARQYLEGDKR